MSSSAPIVNPSNISEGIKSNEYVFSIFSGFVLIGIVIKLFFNDKQSDGSSGPASATIWGYSIISFSLIGVLFIATTLDPTVKGSFKKLLSHGLPIILLLLILFWMVSLNIKYYDKINKGLVANEYYNWSHISTLIMIFQIVLVTLYIKKILSSRMTDNNLSVPASGKGIVAGYFLVLLNTISVGIQQVVLDNFTTDG